MSNSFVSTRAILRMTSKEIFEYIDAEQRAYQKKMGIKPEDVRWQKVKSLAFVAAVFGSSLAGWYGIYKAGAAIFGDKEPISQELKIADQHKKTVIQPAEFRQRN